MMNEATSRENSARDGLGMGVPVPRDPDPPGETSSGVTEEPNVQGLNTVAGPAEEKEAKEDDDHALTTDISPSD